MNKIFHSMSIYLSLMKMVSHTHTHTSGRSSLNMSACGGIADYDKRWNCVLCSWQSFKTSTGAWADACVCALMRESFIRCVRQHAFPVLR